jgi:hypothetical protein
MMLVVLGALIALGTSVLLELFRQWWADRRAKRTFQALLRIEIPTICTAIDALITSYNHLATLDSLVLLQIQSERQGYDHNRDWVILLREDAFRADLIRFYRRLLSAHQDAADTEKLAALPVVQVAYIERRREHIIAEFRDIAVQGRALLQRLDQQ